jgi:hypothetical protein
MCRSPKASIVFSGGETLRMTARMRDESSVGVNDEQTPSGRPAGSLMWAGLANLFSWIDRKNGIGGYWGSQILPFQDAASYPGFVDFESAVDRNR